MARFSPARYRWPEVFRFRHVERTFRVRDADAIPAVPAGDYLRVSARKAIPCRVDFNGAPHIAAGAGVVYVPAALPVTTPFWQGE